MSVKNNSAVVQNQQHKMESYYAFQSKIYDATRWSFLFGRNQLITSIPSLPANAKILEVGCGTGYNLDLLFRRFLDSSIYGLDASKDMLTKARKKVSTNSNVRLVHETYGSTSDQYPDKVDLIVFSYSLSMINPQWSLLLDAAKENLKKDGLIAVVDFEYSQFKWFRNHMANNHVRMEKHLKPKLQDLFTSEIDVSRKAYGGVWQYLTFIGRNR